MATTTEPITTFKCILMGDGGVGKTTFIKRHITGAFERKYIATLGVEVHPLEFNTNYGRICFNVWDCAGQEKFDAFRDSYYIQGDCAIAMGDLNDRPTMLALGTWIRDYERVCPGTPVMCVYNKTDKAEMAIPQNELFSPLFCGISALNNYNYHMPFLILARELTGHDDLEFISNPVDI